MQDFAQTVVEHFRFEPMLTWDLKGLSEATASFSVSSVFVEVSFQQRAPGGPWHVAFDVRRSDRDERSLLFLAFHIFSGVFEAVREFLEIREPEVVVFITKRDELAGIYQTYLNRERSALAEGGYALEGPDRVEPYTQFTLRRTRPSSWRP